MKNYQFLSLPSSALHRNRVEDAEAHVEPLEMGMDSHSHGNIVVIKLPHSEVYLLLPSPPLLLLQRVLSSINQWRFSCVKFSFSFCTCIRLIVERLLFRTLFYKNIVGAEVN